MPTDKTLTCPKNDDTSIDYSMRMDLAPYSNADDLLSSFGGE